MVSFLKQNTRPISSVHSFVLCFGLILAFVTHWCRLQWRRLPNAEEAEGCLNVTHTSRISDEMRCCLTWWRLVIHARTTPNDYREAIAFEMLFVDAKKNKIWKKRTRRVYRWPWRETLCASLYWKRVTAMTRCVHATLHVIRMAEFLKVMKTMTDAHRCMPINSITFFSMMRMIQRTKLVVLHWFHVKINK